MPLFTVILPTHDHQDTLRYSVGSVLAQSHGDLELFIVGDGVPARTREIAAELMAGDPRVRYFDFPKAESRGERLRHPLLLEEARGELVAYQADDDLWLPDHLETLASLLRDADWAHTMQVEMSPDGSAAGRFDDATSAANRAHFLSAWRSVGLNSVGHRLEAYRRLPVGWGPAPHGNATDHYMWCQFYRADWCRFASAPWPTALHLSAPVRHAWSVEERVVELAALCARLSDPLEQSRLRREAQGPLVRRALRSSAERLALLRSSASGAPHFSELLFAPGVRIAFDAAGGGAALLAQGFSLPEHWGVWSVGEQATVLLPFAADAPARLNLVWRLQPFLHGDARRRVRGSLRIGDAGPVALDLDRPLVEVVSRVDRGRRPIVEAVFTVESPASPASLGLSADTRRLGIGLVEIRAEA